MSFSPFRGSRFINSPHRFPVNVIFLAHSNSWFKKQSSHLPIKCFPRATLWNHTWHFLIGISMNYKKCCNVVPSLALYNSFPCNCFNVVIFITCILCQCVLWFFKAVMNLSKEIVVTLFQFLYCFFNNNFNIENSYIVNYHDVERTFQ